MACAHAAPFYLLFSAINSMKTAALHEWESRDFMLFSGREISDENKSFFAFQRNKVYVRHSAIKRH